MRRISHAVLCIILFAAILSFATTAYGQDANIGTFSGEWMTSFTKDDIPASGGGNIKIKLYPDERRFTCKLNGSVSGSAEVRKGLHVRVKSSMNASGCSGTYNPETGSINGGFTANESGTMTLTKKTGKPKSKSGSTSWSGKVAGRIADTAGEGYWKDNEGHSSSWTVSGSFSGAKDEVVAEEDEWESFETDYEKLQLAQELTELMLYSYKDYQKAGGTGKLSSFLKKEFPDPDEFKKVEAAMLIAMQAEIERTEHDKAAVKRIEGYKRSTTEIEKSYDLYKADGGKMDAEEYLDKYIDINIKDPKKKIAVKQMLYNKAYKENMASDPWAWMAYISSLPSSSQAREKDAREIENAKPEKAKKIYSKAVDKKWGWTEDEKARKNKNSNKVRKLRRKANKADANRKNLKGWSAMGNGLSTITGGDKDGENAKVVESNVKRGTSRVFDKMVERCADGKDQRACRNLKKF